MYSSTVRSHAIDPQNRGTNSTANAHGSSDYPPCGDRFTLHLTIENGTIQAATFEAQACGPVVAVGSYTTLFLRGKTLEEARLINCFQLDELLGGLPPSKRHAILLFLDALHQAVTSCVF